MKRTSLFFVACLQASSSAYAVTQLWFTDQPADRRLLKDLHNSHGGLVSIENDVYVKQLWLQQGAGLHDSGLQQAQGGKFHLLDAGGNLMEPVLEPEGMRFKMPDEGFYNAYYTEQVLANQVLNIATAKAEVLKHNCRLGHNYDRALVNPHQWDAAPLDIIRLRLPEEDFHTRIQSGNTLKFRVLHLGKPASGATVKLETEKGWSKTTRTDEQGMARFQIIQDSFATDETAESGSGKPDADSVKQQRPPKSWGNKQAENQEHNADHGSQQREGRGGEHQRHNNDRFLVSATFSSPDVGELDGKPYRQVDYSVAMTGRYTVNIQAAKGTSEALMFSSAGFLTLGVSAALYRRRRIKPFKEISFDEH
ncbi:MAG: DUF4198 domain-containing protein [Gammaproteobacteria bacterium]|nr:DUF4198 domain-containing protein [Gammaproteobacteria bacterium]